MKMISATSPPLVYVWLGSKLPSWASMVIELSSTLCGLNTVLLCSRSIRPVKGITTQIALEDFYLTNTANSVNLNDSDIYFRDGFWNKTTERLLVLKQYQEKYKLDSFFHAELDNIIFDISKLATKLDRCGAGCFVPRDRIDRGIASLIYINNTNALKAIESTLQERPRFFKNDMDLLGYLLQNNSNFISLPTDHALTQNQQTSSWQALSVSCTDGIFDAAAIGQFLFGIDYRNSNTLHYNAFINENSGCNFWDLHFTWDSNSDGMVIKRKIDDQSLNLYNLHVHSKLFKLILDSKKRTYILDRINNKKRTLLKINVWQNRIFKSLSARLRSAAIKLRQRYAT